jgi:coenzyme F420-reducing hydrogenase delta subunit
MRFNILSHDEKLDLQKKLLNKIDLIGGKFNFLTMLEDIREGQKHPLSNKTGKCHFKSGTITWDKHIFEDKIDVLKQIAINAKENNIFLIENEKLKKQALNTIKTMINLEFEVKNKNEKDGEGFSFNPFIKNSDEDIEFDPIFQIIFLDSINNTKNILKYK